MISGGKVRIHFNLAMFCIICSNLVRFVLVKSLLDLSVAFFLRSASGKSSGEAMRPKKSESL